MVFHITDKFCKRCKLVAALIVAAFKRKHLADNIELMYVDASRYHLY